MKQTADSFIEEEYGYHTHTAEPLEEESIRGEGTKGVRMDVVGCEESVRDDIHMDGY